jgi:large subunit ribosomal protein L4
VKTKNRGEVSGSGKKPWRQKGTGRARAGSVRSPLWRKGGTTFGPQPRDYAYELPKRMRRLALIAGLKGKAQEGKLFLVDEITCKEGKTREFAALTDRLALKKPVVILDAPDALAARSARNLKHVVLTTSDQVAPYDVLASDECLFTKKGYARLLERLGKGAARRPAGREAA